MLAFSFLSLLSSPFRHASLNRAADPWGRGHYSVSAHNFSSFLHAFSLPPSHSGSNFSRFSDIFWSFLQALSSPPTHFSCSLLHMHSLSSLAHFSPSLSPHFLSNLSDALGLAPPSHFSSIFLHMHSLSSLAHLPVPSCSRRLL